MIPVAQDPEIESGAGLQRVRVRPEEPKTALLREWQKLHNYATTICKTPAEIRANAIEGLADFVWSKIAPFGYVFRGKHGPQVVHRKIVYRRCGNF